MEQNHSKKPRNNSKVVNLKSKKKKRYKVNARLLILILSIILVLVSIILIINKIIKQPKVIDLYARYI